MANPRIKTVDRIFYQQLGSKLARIRLKRNITQKELSQLTGYSRTLIDNWELGISKIKDQQLEKICMALDITNNLSCNVKIGFLLDD